jgi:hypothetical protein
MGKPGARISETALFATVSAPSTALFKPFDAQW